MKNAKEGWEKRSEKYGRKIEGVLPKSYPRAVNRYIDDWMFSMAENSIPKEGKVKVLDIGCGYGRVAKRILRGNSKAVVFGVDIAGKYVDLFNEELNPRGKAKLADARDLPYGSGVFDVVLIIGTLMYIVDEKDRIKVMKEAFRVLKNSGAVVLIEGNASGIFFMQLLKKIKDFFLPDGEEIALKIFSKREIHSLAKKCRAKITYASGIPTVSFFLPALLLIGRINQSFLGIALKIFGKVDRALSRILAPSIFVSYVFVKDQINDRK